MTAEEERWAQVLLAVRLYDNPAPDWIAERIAALAYAGDEAGVRPLYGNNYTAGRAERRNTLMKWWRQWLFYAEAALSTLLTAAALLSRI